MKSKLITFNFLILSFVFISISSKSLKFPFHIIPKSPENNEKKSNLKSLLEIDHIPVSTNSEDRMCLELCFGTPKICHLLTIHAQSFLMWVSDARANFLSYKDKKQPKYDATKSTTGRYNQSMIEVILDSEKILRGNAVYDRIYTKDSFLFRGVFLSVLDSNHYTGEGMIGLGYRGSKYEERFSFINQLYFNGLIYHRVFTQYFENDKNGVITFGEIPEEIVTNYKKYGRCNALNIEKDGKIYKNRKWECELNGIYFGDVYDEKYVHWLEDTRTSFFSFRKRALVPKYVFDFFANTYFSSLIQKNYCERVLIGKYDTIKCYEEIIEGPKINLIFGDWTMSISVDKLFIYSKKSKSYEFIFYNKKNFDHWSLGRPVVRLFHMVYDYQNQEIGFYSQKNVNYINKISDPEPPKIFEKLIDGGELVDENENNDPNLVPENEENIKQRKKRKTAKDIVDEIKKESGINENTVTKSVSDALVIQNAFKIFVIIVIICFIVFIGFLYYRHKRKMRYLKSDYFLKKANELQHNNNNNINNNV